MQFPVFRMLGVLVAISGAASLIYELLWIRALGLHFGTTTPAVSAVVATFMAGLALGSRWLGRLADASPQPLRLYRRIELVCAGTGLTTSLLLVHGGDWLDAAARVCARAGALSTLAMSGVFALLMLPPTIAMGGSLPVLTRALRRPQPARSLSVLYACNTLGAVCGALLPDFALIPRCGWTLTACAAAAANLAVALAVSGARGIDAAMPAARPRAALDQDTRTPPVAVHLDERAALALSAVSGFCALGLEVLWNRTLQQWAAAWVTSFSVLLAVYLIMLALGTALAQRWAAQSRTPLAHAALLSVAAAVACLLPIVAAPGWRSLQRQLWPRPEGFRRLGLGHETIDALLHATYLEGLTCLLLGASFPFVAAAWLRRGQAGTRAGTLFMVNTLGGVLGSLVLGFAGLPYLGEQASYCGLALLLAGTAGASLLFATRGPRMQSALGLPRPRTVPGLAALGCACALAFALAMPRGQLQRAHFQSGGELLAVRQGATTSAAAVAHYVYGERHYLELQTPGISMSSTRLGPRRYMALMAHSALLLAHQPRRALLLCYGVGNTASALLSHPELERLDVVDISPEVLSLAPYFAAHTGDSPLRDARTRVFVDDGRHHLISHDTRYDVITAEPPPPHHAGVVNLYSRELYRLAKRRLSRAGVITQWLPVFQLSNADVRAMLAAFVAELPYTALLYGYGQQLILIGSRAPLALDAAQLKAAERPEHIAQLRRSGIAGVDAILGAVLQTDAELRRAVAGVAPLRDEQPTIEYPGAALAAGQLYSARFGPNPARALYLLGDAASPARERAVRTAADTIARVLPALPWLEQPSSASRELQLGRLLTPALRAQPSDEGLWALLAVDADRVRLARAALARPDAEALLNQPQAQLRGHARARQLVLHDALWLLARRAFYAGEYIDALGWLRRFTPEPSRAASYALLRAGCLRALERYAQSATAFRAAAALSGDASFRSECQALAEAVSRPFAPDAGPWSSGVATGP